MADVYKYAPLMFKFEGGLANVKGDKGGLTNMGVTLTTLKQIGLDKDGNGVVDAKDLKLLTQKDVVDKVLKPHYWDKWKADKIKTQSIANLLVDWTYTSGVYGIKFPQQILGVAPDGKVGDKTIAAVNNYPNQKELFQKLWNRRKAHFEAIVRNNPTQKKFLAGWLNRLNQIKYTD